MFSRICTLATGRALSLLRVLIRGKLFLEGPAVRMAESKRPTHLVYEFNHFMMMIRVEIDGSEPVHCAFNCFCYMPRVSARIEHVMADSLGAPPN